MATVTINNHEQRQVEQRMLVNQLVDNGFGSMLKSVGGSFKAGKVFGKTGGGLGKIAKSKGSIGGKIASGAGALVGKAQRTGAYKGASRFAGSTAGKMTGMGAGLAGTAGAGVAVGRASGSRRRRK